MRTPSIRSNLTYTLRTLLGKKVRIKVRLYNSYLEGYLASFDQYLMVLLKDAKEYYKDPESGIIEEVQSYEGLVLIRGDAIVNIKKVS